MRVTIAYICTCTTNKRTSSLLTPFSFHSSSLSFKSRSHRQQQQQARSHTLCSAARYLAPPLTTRPSTPSLQLLGFVKQAHTHLLHILYFGCSTLVLSLISTVSSLTDNPLSRRTWRFNPSRHPSPQATRATCRSHLIPLSTSLHNNIPIQPPLYHPPLTMPSAVDEKSKHSSYNSHHHYHGHHHIISSEGSTSTSHNDSRPTSLALVPASGSKHTPHRSSSTALLSLSQDVTALVSLSIEAAASLVNDYTRIALSTFGLGQRSVIRPGSAGPGLAVVVVGAADCTYAPIPSPRVTQLKHKLTQTSVWPVAHPPPRQVWIHCLPIHAHLSRPQCRNRPNIDSTICRPPRLVGRAEAPPYPRPRSHGCGCPSCDRR